MYLKPRTLNTSEIDTFRIRPKVEQMLVQSCVLWISLEPTRVERPDSSVGKASAFGAGARGFESRPHHTKGVKNGTGGSLADARIKGVVSVKKILLCRNKSSTELMLFVSNKRRSIKLRYRYW